jgi:hypothetical protein
MPRVRLDTREPRNDHPMNDRRVELIGDAQMRVARSINPGERAPVPIAEAQKLVFGTVVRDTRRVTGQGYGPLATAVCVQKRTKGGIFRGEKQRRPAAARGRR